MQTRRYPMIRGKVIQGRGRGRTLGFPTANIRIHQRILPEGVYVGYAQFKTQNSKSKTYPSLLFFGSAKTFGEKEYRGEAYFLGFRSNLYGKWITLLPIKRLRSNRKFSSAKVLRKQMEKDLLTAQSFFEQR